MTRNTRIAKKAVHTIVVIALMALILVPFYVAIIYAFKPKAEVGVNRLALPEHWTLENFHQVIFQNDSVLVGFRNSFLTTVPSVR